MSNASKNRKWLLGLLIFNAASAIGGGIALMLDKTGMPLESLADTGFTSYYFPGVILFAVVGGSALIAAIATYKQLPSYQLAVVVSGVVMLAWIVGEVVSIRQLHWLQLPYFASALTVLALKSGSK